MNNPGIANSDGGAQDNVSPIRVGQMRAKGLLEIAAGLYPASSRAIANRVEITISGRRENVSVTLATGGLLLLPKVARRRVDIGWINPMAGLAMAVRGAGPFRAPLPLRVLAVFPSLDWLVFAVPEDSGIASLADVRRRRYPLRIATRTLSRDDTTMFAISEVLRFHGLSFRQIRGWGGEIHHHTNPTSPRRIEAIRTGTVDAVFDEGVPIWGPEALAAGMRFLSLSSDVVDHMTRLGFRRAVLPVGTYPGLAEDVVTLDFSGWPVFAHQELDEAVAFAVCAAIEARAGLIPVDQPIPLDIRQLCNQSAACPIDAPLHPGAERFYREHGYL
ncbi:MAG: hypothetical protein EXR51_04710 [Dehalococcoidia bacterium]|nr:hypothetical protein [Dehalococcoidia bacterium]